MEKINYKNASSTSPLSGLFNHVTFFFLKCFWWKRSPCCLFSPLPPLRGQPTGKCHPRWQPIYGLGVLCRLGRLLDSNPGL
jgi:hypothetical protein